MINSRLVDTPLTQQNRVEKLGYKISGTLYSAGLEKRLSYRLCGLLNRLSGGKLWLVQKLSIHTKVGIAF